MIVSFKHKGLQEYWERGIASKLPADQRNKIRLILDTLHDVNFLPYDLLPFKHWHVHQLNGNYEGYWSVTVKENWRIIFRFENGNILDLNFLDYH